MICKNCNNEVNLEATFCTNCGHPAEQQPLEQAGGNVQQPNPIQAYVNSAMPEPHYQQEPNQYYAPEARYQPPSAYSQELIDVPPLSPNTAQVPIPMGKFLGYMCAVFIPCIGPLVALILLFNAAFGKGENPSFSNWAKATLIFLGILLAMFLLAAVGNYL